MCQMYYKTDMKCLIVIVLTHLSNTPTAQKFIFPIILILFQLNHTVCIATLRNSHDPRT